MAKIATFDDWIDLFKQWQKEIHYDPAMLGAYTFEDKFGELSGNEIEFGDYKGQPRWETVRQIPEQRIRDSLLNLIVYQGDTEFASVEQQRNLIETAPSDYDLQSLIRVNREEMRHGWQMSFLLVKYFGDSGKVEAQKLLERRAFKHNRLLGSFNVEVNNWLDFFIYTQFVDRDGRYQLNMLSRSSFAPLARSMGPMLKEEVYHLLTGNTGLTRIIKAGRIPTEIIQRHFNKWWPTAVDLFGNDRSSSAHWSYVWGLKGRYDEEKATTPADLQHLNEAARALYVEESKELVEALNRFVPEGHPKLHLPSPEFHRKIGDYAHQPYGVGGELLTPEAYAAHLQEVLPGAEDLKRLEGIFREKDWIVSMN